MIFNNPVSLVALAYWVYIKFLYLPIAKNTTNILQIYHKVSQIYDKSTVK